MSNIVQDICGLVENATDAAIAWHAQHTASPGGWLDYVLVAAGAVAVLLVCVYTVKFLVKPQERDPDHIKRRILRDDPGSWRQQP